MSLKMIVATGLNFEIGVDNRLLWHLPEDMKYFKEQTLNSSFVIMGRKTFESLNSPFGLKDRYNMILTNQEVSREDRFKRLDTKTCLIYPAWENAVQDTAVCCKESWLIGGSQIYESFIDYVDEIHWTYIEKVYPEANRFLTDKTIDKMVKDFDKGVRVKKCYDERSDTHFTINVLKRIKQST